MQSCSGHRTILTLNISQSPTAHCIIPHRIAIRTCNWQTCCCKNFSCQAAQAVAFVWLLTTIRFQSTFVVVWPSSNVCFQNFSSGICLAFLHCAFSNASSNCLPEKMQNHTGCIWLFSTVWLIYSLPSSSGPKISIFVLQLLNQSFEKNE